MCLTFTRGSTVERKGKWLPSFVERTFERFLGCGDVRTGFAWLECMHCDSSHKVVPCSCGSRGFCPTCGGRRMVEHSLRWVDDVFPVVPVRQWVMTVPWGRRWLFARHHDLARGVFKIGVHTIFSRYRRWARKKGYANIQCGSVSLVQRFGSSLNLNVHLHALMMDGVYATHPQQGRGLHFVRVPAPSTEEVGVLVEKIARRAERWLAKQGYETNEDWDVDACDALPLFQEASIAGRTATGARRGMKVRRVQKFAGREFQLPPRCASFGGYNLHGGVQVSARNRKGLEALCRYIARPPLAKNRLVVDEEGEYRILLKTPWSDGTTSIQVGLLELMERLAAIIPQPRTHQVLYYGVFANNAKYRKEIQPKYKRVRKPSTWKKLSRKDGSNSRHVAWAQLLWRSFGVMGFVCQHCGCLMRLRAVAIYPPATTKILRGLGVNLHGLGFTGPP